MKPDLVSVVTAHMVYFCAFARSEIFLENARKSGVGRGQFDAGVNGLNIFIKEYFNYLQKLTLELIVPVTTILCYLQSETILSLLSTYQVRKILALL